MTPDKQRTRRYLKAFDFKSLFVDELDTFDGDAHYLSSASGARLRTYERLKQFADAAQRTLFPPSPELVKAVDDIYRYPLRESAKDTLNRQIRSDIPVDELAKLVIRLREEDHLCLIQEEKEQQEPQIICSLGLFTPAGNG